MPRGWEDDVWTEAVWKFGKFHNLFWKWVICVSHLMSQTIHYRYFTRINISKVHTELGSILQRGLSTRNTRQPIRKDPRKRSEEDPNQSHIRERWMIDGRSIQHLPPSKLQSCSQPHQWHLSWRITLTRTLSLHLLLLLLHQLANR